MVWPVTDWTLRGRPACLGEGAWTVMCRAALARGDARRVSGFDHTGDRPTHAGLDSSAKSDDAGRIAIIDIDVAGRLHEVKAVVSLAEPVWMACRLRFPSRSAHPSGYSPK